MYHFGGKCQPSRQVSLTIWPAYIAVRGDNLLYVLALIGAAACIGAAGWAALILYYRLRGSCEEWEEYP